MISSERRETYSRVPSSKFSLAGKETSESRVFARAIYCENTTDNFQPSRDETRLLFNAHYCFSRFTLFSRAQTKASLRVWTDSLGLLSKWSPFSGRTFPIFGEGAERLIFLFNFVVSKCEGKRGSKIYQSGETTNWKVETRTRWKKSVDVSSSS